MPVLSSDANVVGLGLKSANEARIYEWDESPWTRRVTTFVVESSSGGGEERNLRGHKVVDLGWTLALSDSGNEGWRWRTRALTSSRSPSTGQFRAR